MREKGLQNANMREPARRSAAQRQTDGWPAARSVYRLLARFDGAIAGASTRDQSL
jgi:hypothetical protein